MNEGGSPYKTSSSFFLELTVTCMKADIDSYRIVNDYNTKIYNTLHVLL